MNKSEVALIVGGGPGISASCAQLFSQQGVKVAVAARDPDKPVLKALAQDHGVTLIACDASVPESVAAMFNEVSRTLGAPRLVVHNIDGRPREVFRKSITEVEPAAVLTTLTNSTFSAFVVGQQAAKAMLSLEARGWSQRHDRVHQRQRGAEGFSAQWCVCRCVPRQGGPCTKHGPGTYAAGHPRGPCADRCGHRLGATRWITGPSPGR